MFGRKKDSEPEHEYAFDISEFEEKEIQEIERVKQMLEAAEVIKTVARQSRVMPGGSLVTPNIIFATNRRVIIKDPTALGLRAGIDSIPYSQINKVHIKKGALTSELKLDIGQYDSDDNREVIPAIPKKKATELVGIINQYLRGAQDNSQQVASPPQKDEDPLKILKIRFAKGEISKEEYEEMKSALE